MGCYPTKSRVEPRESAVGELLERVTHISAGKSHPTWLCTYIPNVLELLTFWSVFGIIGYTKIQKGCSYLQVKLPQHEFVRLQHDKTIDKLFLNYNNADFFLHVNLHCIQIHSPRHPRDNNHGASGDWTKDRDPSPLLTKWSGKNGDNFETTGLEQPPTLLNHFRHNHGCKGKSGNISWWWQEGKRNDQRRKRVLNLHKGDHSSCRRPWPCTQAKVTSLFSTFL